MEQPPQLRTLEAGRGLAALAVLVYHADLSSAFFSGGEASALAALGRFGVDFFFLLSGFILAHKHGHSAWNLRQFASRRAARIYLPYLPVGIAMAVAYSAFPGVSRGTWEWCLLPTLTLAPTQCAPALSVAWTLQHEVLFYAIFAALMTIGALRRGIATWAAMIVLTAATLDHAPFALELRNLEFCIGVWLGLNRRLPQLLEGCRTPAWLLYAGAVSYSLYLVHNPVISGVSRVLPGAGYGTLFLASIAVSMVAAILYHHSIEKSAIKHLSKLRHAGRKLVFHLERETIGRRDRQVGKSRRVEPKRPIGGPYEAKSAGRAVQGHITTNIR